MLPAHNHITTVCVVPVITEVAAAKLKLDPDSLPALVATIDTTFCLAVWVSGMNGLDNEPQFITDHAEQENNALFVDRCMT